MSSCRRWSGKRSFAGLMRPNGFLRPEHSLSKCGRLANSENEAQRAEAEFYQMLASEHRAMFNSSSQQASSIDSFGAIPLVVMASGVPNPMFGDVAERYQLYWAEQSEALSAKSSQGRFVFAEASTHRLHDDASDFVSDIVLSMVHSVRQKGE